MRSVSQIVIFAVAALVPENKDQAYYQTGKCFRI